MYALPSTSKTFHAASQVLYGEGNSGWLTGEVIDITSGVTEQPVSSNASAIALNIMLCPPLRKLTCVVAY